MISLARLFRVMVALAVTALAVVVLWGARFHYDHIVVDNETYLVRVSRVSGHADVLIPGDGWVPAEDAWSDDGDEQPQSPS